MPAVISKCNAFQQQEREARNEALEANRQETIKKNTSAALCCPVSYCPYAEAHKHYPYTIRCGHSLCSLCVNINLPRMWPGEK